MVALLQKKKKGLSLVKPYTNADKINDMSVEEKAKFLNTNIICDFCARNNDDCGDLDCEQGIKEWLESEATQERKGG